jgi:DNA-binding response OmpR family regulator
MKESGIYPFYNRIYSTMQPAANTIGKVLLIDDDMDELDLLESALHQINPEIQVYFSDKCDHEKLQSIPTPDLVFLDINMPGCSGFEWLEAIRAKVPFPIPVIMYSTTRSEEHVIKSHQLGANLFVTKPNRASDLVALLTRILQYDWSDPAQVTEQSFNQGEFHLCTA